MTLTLDGVEFSEIEMSPEDIKLEIAIMLYQKGHLSLGKASQVVSMNKILFQKELGKRSVPINYDEEELETDLANLGLL